MNPRPTSQNTPPHVPPNVVVLMASYNGAAWIEAQIDSILQSADVSCHIILSDDGSSDDTVAIAQRAGEDRLTQLASPGRLGAAQNFIHLMRHADLSGASYVALSDQDDLWRADKVSRAVSCLAEADAYSCDVTAFWPDGRTRLIRKSYPQKRHDHLFEYGSAGSTFVFPIETALKLRALLEAADPGTLSQVDSHDWLFYALLRAAGLRWTIDAWSGVQYRQHGRNHRGAWSGIGALRSRIERLRSGWFRRQVLVMVALTGQTCAMAEYLRRPSFGQLAVPFRHAWHCRRRPRDAAVLMVLAIGAGVLGSAWKPRRYQSKTPARGGRG